MTSLAALVKCSLLFCLFVSAIDTLMTLEGHILSHLHTMGTDAEGGGRGSTNKC